MYADGDSLLASPFTRRCHMSNGQILAERTSPLADQRICALLCWESKASTAGSGAELASKVFALRVMLSKRPTVRSNQRNNEREPLNMIPHLTRAHCFERRWKTARQNIHHHLQPQRCKSGCVWATGGRRLSA